MSPADDKDDEKEDDEKKPPSPEDKTDWKALYEKEKALNRKIEVDNKKNNDRIRELEDSGKSEMDMLREKLKVTEDRVSAAERDALVKGVALSKKLTPAQAKRLVGNTEEELITDADDLLATFAKPEEEDTDRDSRRRPQERLRPGTRSDTDEKLNVKEVVDKMMAESR